MMLPIGTTLIVCAVVAALGSSVSYALVPAGRTRLLRWGRVGVWASLGFAAAAAALILALFVAQRYDIRYVFDYSSRELEFRYRVAAVWAGQPGSLIVWALAGLICAPLLIRRTRQFEPYVLAPLMFLQAILIVFMLFRNPFVPTALDTVPAGLLQDGVITDGRGLNPQLHNVWMVIHPPTLFLGYGVLGVPFSMALAALWRRDYDGWIKMALPWTIAGWVILGIALTMGGYWAYESLGWGGYWGWDPVENAALVPWLTGAALMHGMLVQRTHGGLRRANFFLAILTYVLVFYASFLTRSGVLGSFSVHSFVEEGLKGVMLGAMGVLIVGSLALLFARWRDVPRKEMSESLLSRDTAFVLLMLTFVTVALIVAFGTSIPWITSIQGLSYSLEQFFSRAFALDDGSRYSGQAFGDGRFGLLPDFFKRTTTPLALILAILMALGPLLGWRDTNVRKLLFALRWPFVAMVIVTSIGMVLGVRDGMSIAFLAIATFAAGSNLLMIIRTLRSGWLRIGGYLSHVGMALLLVGVVGSYAYASPEEKLVIPQGETQSIFGHSFTFWGYDEKPDGKHVLRLEVDREGGAPFVAAPDVYFNARMGAQVRTPAIKRYLWQDLYISPEDYLPARDPNMAEATPGQQIEIGPYSLKFDKFDIQDHLQTEQYATVGAVVTVTHGDTVTTVTPQLRAEPGKPWTELPVDLPGGNRLVLENINPGAGLAQLRVEGLNQPVVPAVAVFTVSIKPAIALVWLGSLLMAFGGLIAVIRRRWEAAPAREPVRSQPRGWGQRVLGWRLRTAR
jgi:cytochrome c-type biogenesis protein CcmF